MHAQTIVDGDFNEWDSNTEWVDDNNDGGNGLELLSLNVSNDDRFLFLKIRTEESIAFGDENDLRIYLDLDNDISTGFIIDGIGADLVWDGWDVRGYVYADDNYYDIFFEDVFFRALPTVTSKQGELAFQVFNNSNFPMNQLSIGNEFRIKIIASQDVMPDSGETYNYTVNQNPVSFDPVSFDKQDLNDIRLLSWNTEFNGITDSGRKDAFLDVINTVQPDIIAFQETWDVYEDELLDVLAEADQFFNWQIHKNDDNNLIASKYPILEATNILQGARMQAVYIDLPDAIFKDNLLLINAHLSCCENEAGRQNQADAFARFIINMKFGMGPFSIPVGTPFMLCGDLNLVEGFQPLQTILTGDIQDVATFGYGGGLDWNEADLTDLNPVQSDIPFSITWRNDFSSFTPGRLDYMIYSASVLDIANNFVIQTEVMSDDRLNSLNLNEGSTNIASDHFPMISDLVVRKQTVSIEEDVDLSINVWPNPVQDLLYFDETFFQVLNYNGQIIAEGFNNHIDMSAYASGIYFFKTEKHIHKIIKQ